MSKTTPLGQVLREILTMRLAVGSLRDDIERLQEVAKDNTNTYLLTEMDDKLIALRRSYEALCSKWHSMTGQCVITRHRIF
jgi:hypothetical protein